MDLIENIRVRTRADKVQFVSCNLVDQQPVWLDVCVPVAIPLALERMVEVFRGKRLGLDQQDKQCFELAHVLAALFRRSGIALELAGADRLAHVRCPGP